ncbi:MAG TPA: FecR domain-containing protein, partial [Gammaproteobacteria bacterium]|nr:FecR domain-containing protein [Gammaproteobacteria bacterium]
MTLHRFATQSWFLLALLFLLAGPGLTGSAAAQEGREVVGKVIIATAGSVARGPDGEERRLRRRSKLFTGDTVVTSAEGRVQIRFSDGSLLGLKPKSEFRIEEYHYAGEADGSENAVYKLLKGGMRTITGAIGKTRKENYKVETEAATIGIRGTHYLLQVCSSGCGSQQAKGVFGGVVNGAISVSNDSGESTFGRDQYFQVPSADAAPKQLLRPPEFLADTAPIEESGEGDEQDESDAEGSGDADGESEGGDGGDEGDTDGDAGGETDADGGDDTGTDGETGGTTTSEETSTDDGGDEFSLESDTELSGDDTLSDGDTTL